MDTKNIDRYADKLLVVLTDLAPHTLYDTCEIQFQDVNDDEAGILIRHMERKDLIDKFGSNGLSWKISPFGLEVVNQYGGWLKYLTQNESEHRELIRLRDEKEAFEKRHIRLNTAFAFGMFIFAAIGAYGVKFGIDQANKNTILEQQLETIGKEKTQLAKVRHDQDSLLEKRNKEIQKLTLKIDSLSQLPTHKKNK